MTGKEVEAKRQELGVNKVEMAKLLGVGRMTYYRQVKLEKVSKRMEQAVQHLAKHPEKAVPKTKPAAKARRAKKADVAPVVFPKAVDITTAQVRTEIQYQGKSVPFDHIVAYALTQAPKDCPVDLYLNIDEGRAYWVAGRRAGSFPLLSAEGKTAAQLIGIR